MSNTKSIPQAYCGCPVRQAPEVRGDATDTMTEHVDGCTAGCDDAPVSKLWACPNDCGYNIADGPTGDGEQTTTELIQEHLEYECPSAGRIDVDDPAELVRAEELGLITLDATAVPDPEPDSERAAYTTGLREIADWLDAHPEVPLPYLGSTMMGPFEPTLPIFLVAGDQRGDLATIARAMGSFDKHGDGGRFYIGRRFGSIAVVVSASRDEVCDRVVTGAREVTEEVPDPEALAAVPKVTVTKTVEDVRWECRPLLAADPRATRPRTAIVTAVA